jgi:hypothetical protein
VVGDRLDTDVLGAIRGGSDSLLVLTGVGGVDDALTAAAGTRPTYVSWDLRGLIGTQPAVTLRPRQADCDGAQASYDDGRIVVNGRGVGALRAACALAWQCADEGLPVAGADGLEQ